jgi:hypothetical protein
VSEKRSTEKIKYQSDHRRLNDLALVQRMNRNLNLGHKL